MMKRYLLLPFIMILFATGAYAQTTITRATGNYPTAGALDADANFYVVQYDAGNNEYDVVKYTAASEYSTSSVIYSGLYFAGEYPSDVEVASNGDVYMLDGFDEPARTGAILRLDASYGYSSSRIPLLGSYPVALGIDGNDDIYVSEYDGGTNDNQLVKYDVSAGYASTVLYNGLGIDTYPRELTGDLDGNVYVPTFFGKDAANGKILKLTAPGYDSTIVDHGDYYTGLAINGNGDLFAAAYKSGADNYHIVKYTGGSGSTLSVATGHTYSGSSYSNGLGSNLALGDLLIPDPWTSSNGQVFYLDQADPITNQAPTNISLNSTSVNQSGGTNATVGTLSTTDPDGGDTHLYSLVAGTGDDKNTSFNISGSELLANDASELIAGDYSVRIQTDDGIDTYEKEFAITVISSNADLSDFNLSTGTLNLVFDSGTTSYTTDVSYQESSIAVTPTSADGNASITVDGGPLISDSESDPIMLELGANAIDIVVTAEDGFTKTYTFDVTRNHPFADGVGTETDPYHIVTAEQLNYVREFLNSYFIQIADIDLGVSPWSDGNGWEPIGTFGDRFTGSYDGKGNTISNLFIDRPTQDYVGLIGVTFSDAAINNLNLKNVNVTGRDRTGGLIGESRGNVSNVSVSGSVTGTKYIGGIFGIIESNSVVSSSYSTVDVTGSMRIGGLTGYIYGTLENSYVVGGSVDGSLESGGLIGTAYQATVTNTYSANTGVDANPIFGNNINGESVFTNNFWDADVTGVLTSDGGTGLTSEELKAKSIFTDTGWDFDSVWQIDEPGIGSVSYPYLQGNSQDPAPGYLPATVPVVTTGTGITSITASSAVVAGNVTDDGNLTLSDRGFVWSVAVNPDINDNVESLGAGSGGYSETLENLPPGTTIYVRAYATNQLGTSYGSKKSFETEKQELTITGSFTVSNKVYDGNTTAVTDQNNLVLNNIFTGHDVSLTGINPEFTIANVADNIPVTFSVTSLSGVDANRYTLSLIKAPTAIANITTRSITISADPVSIAYGDTDPALTYEITAGSLVPGEQLTGNLSRVNGQNVGTYTIQQGTLTAGANYDISYQSADFEITTRTLAITADADQSKTYGETDPAFTFKASNFGWTDDVSTLYGDLIRTAGEAAGLYEIGQGNLNAGNNYTISYTAADFKITAKKLKVVADTDQYKTYGEDDPSVFTFTASNFANGDETSILSGSLSRAGGEDAGMYTITAGDLSAGPNYQVNFTPADFEVRPAGLTITAVEDQTKTYGDDDPDFAWTAEGFQFNDYEHIVTGQINREPGETPGDYALWPGNLTAGTNYEIEFTGADLSILRTPPVVVQQVPGEAEKRVALDAVITTEFDHEITVADFALITLTGPGATAIPLTVSAYGSILTLTHGGLSHHTEYTLTIGGNAVENVDGIGNEATTWSFTTIMLAPVAENPSPVDGAMYVGVNDPLSVSFSQDVTLADASGISIVSGQGGSPGDIQTELSDNLLMISHRGLDHDTEYTISVPQGTVQNADGVGNEPVSWSFISIVPVPDPVMLGAPVNHEGAVSLDAAFEWESTPHAEHYRIQLSEAETFDTPLEDVDQLTEFTFTPAEPLSDYQTYFWRVKAANDAGESEWSDARQFMTTANTPNEVFPLMNAENISIAPMLEWNSEYGTTYRVQLGATSGFETLVADSLTTNQAVQITGLEEDAEYYWRVRVETDSTASSWTDARQFRTRSAASTEDDEQVVDHSVTFGETSNQEERVISELDYRMVGLPGNDHHGVEDFFEGKYGRDWKVFYDNGNVTEYYNEYKSGDNRFVFAPGRGFWVLSTDIMDLDLKITSVTTNERDAYSVSLHPGWNIITNPHRGPVSWSDVQEMNGFTGFAWGYDQRFVLADTLHPVQGYYVYNHPDQPRDYLDIPYATMEQRRSEDRGKKLLAVNSTAPMPTVNLSAKFEDNRRFDIQILYPDLEGAQDSADKLDEESLRRYYPSLEISRSGMMLVNEKHIASGGLLREVSRFDGDGAEYELHLKGKTGQKFNWKLNLQQMPVQTRALVVNRANSKAWLLKHGEEVEATLTDPNAVYELYTGDRDRLEQLQKDLMPQEFALEPNYPNPFNPITNIRYSLPNQQHVKLEVYDVIGRRVQVLTNDVQQAGWHVVQFNAGSLASGVYLYRLTTNNNVKVRKMTLVK